jgi:hypothetical protein
MYIIKMQIISRRYYPIEPFESYKVANIYQCDATYINRLLLINREAIVNHKEVYKIYYLESSYYLLRFVKNPEFTDLPFP